jgi:hypothetical protein
MQATPEGRQESLIIAAMIDEQLLRTEKESLQLFFGASAIQQIGQGSHTCSFAASSQYAVVEVAHQNGVIRPE